jgi:hypothetical protein
MIWGLSLLYEGESSYLVLDPVVAAIPLPPSMVITGSGRTRVRA